MTHATSTHIINLGPVEIGAFNDKHSNHNCRGLVPFRLIAYPSLNIEIDLTDVLLAVFDGLSLVINKYYLHNRVAKIWRQSCTIRNSHGKFICLLGSAANAYTSMAY